MVRAILKLWMSGYSDPIVMYLSLLNRLSVLIFLCAISSANGASFEEIRSDVNRAIDEGKVSNFFNIDNDSFLASKQPDRFYTGGIRYARQYTISGATASNAYGWRIGHEMYTAASTQTKPRSIRPLDHPYAAWLYGGAYRETYQLDGSYLKTGLDVGCLGPCAGGEGLQTNYHKLVDRKLPKGWSTQVRNEIGLIL